MSDIVGQLLLQVFLILLNAFFAMTEIAVISLNPVRLRKQAEDGDKKAVKLLKMVEEPSGFLSTIQVGITLAGFLGSAFAADHFSEMLVSWLYDDLGIRLLSLKALDGLAVVVITLILSYFTLVFGELVPKRIAMQKSAQVARIASGIVSSLSSIVKPIVWLLTVSTNLVLKLLRLKTQAEEETVTEEDIRMMVDQGEENGSIDSEEGEWIDNVLEFGDSIVRECMTHILDVEAFPAEASMESILDTISEQGFSRYPVYQNDIHNVIGVLNAREFLLNLNAEQPKPLGDLLRPAYFVPETARASVLFKDMQKKKTHLAIVVNEYGETSGVVSMEDLLELIVGNIYDEFDETEPEEIVQLEENLWRIAGSAHIDAIAEVLDAQIPEDVEFDTLTGMVFSCLSMIPQDGTSVDVECYGLKIHVEQIMGRKITDALVSKVSSDDLQDADE